jgi:hypothetical protein
MKHLFGIASGLTMVLSAFYPKDNVQFLLLSLIFAVWQLGVVLYEIADTFKRRDAAEDKQ